MLFFPYGSEYHYLVGSAFDNEYLAELRASDYFTQVREANGQVVFSDLNIFKQSQEICTLL